MEKEEHDRLLNAIPKEIEIDNGKALLNIALIKKDYGEQLEKIAAAEKKAAELESRNEELRSANQNLFAMVGAPPNPEYKKEEEKQKKGEPERKIKPYDQIFEEMKEERNKK